MKILVACARPGLIRGGQRNPAFAAYPLDHFTAAQVAELLAEPAISLAIGEPIGVDVLESYKFRGDQSQTWWDFLNGIGPLVNQGAPSLVPDPATALTGADVLPQDTLTPGHAGVAEGSVSAAVDDAEAALLKGHHGQRPAAKRR